MILEYDIQNSTNDGTLMTTKVSLDSEHESRF